MTKEIRSPNVERLAVVRLALVSSFGFRHCFGFRHSSFGFGNCSLFNPIGSWIVLHRISSLAFLRPVWWILQPVQHLPRLWHQQNAFVLAVRELFDANAGRVAVTEVD